jgi:hypothetical protein
MLMMLPQPCSIIAGTAAWQQRTGGAQINVHYQIPLLDRALQEGRVRPNPGVVHQHVNTSQRVQRLLRQALNVLLHSYVAADGQRPSAPGFNLGGGGVNGAGNAGTLGFGPGGHHHGGAGFGQTQGDCLANAPAGTRDNRHFTVQ